MAEAVRAFDSAVKIASAKALGASMSRKRLRTRQRKKGEPNGLNNAHRKINIRKNSTAGFSGLDFVVITSVTSNLDAVHKNAITPLASRRAINLTKNGVLLQGVGLCHGVHHS